MAAWREGQHEHGDILNKNAKKGAKLVFFLFFYKTPFSTVGLAGIVYDSAIFSALSFFPFSFLFFWSLGERCLLCKDWDKWYIGWDGIGV